MNELWIGATSNLHYQEHTKIFEQQQKFSEQDLVGENKDRYIPFSNILDQGCRCILLMQRAGGQDCFLPIFSKSDQCFIGNETVVLTSVALDRSGNKRAVNICKTAGFIKQVLTGIMSTIRLNNDWLAWSFQANFMYAPVQ